MPYLLIPGYLFLFGKALLSVPNCKGMLKKSKSITDVSDNVNC